MKKDKYYPVLYEKASKHLVKPIFKDGIAFWFEGGDFLKRNPHNGYPVLELHVLYMYRYIAIF